MKRISITLSANVPDEFNLEQCKAILGGLMHSESGAIIEELGEDTIGQCFDDLKDTNINSSTDYRFLLGESRSFCQLIDIVEANDLLTRVAWKGKKFIWINRRRTVPADKVSDPLLKGIAITTNNALKLPAEFCMKNEYDMVEGGWRPSADDVLAKDWVIVKATESTDKPKE